MHTLQTEHMLGWTVFLEDTHCESVIERETNPVVRLGQVRMTARECAKVTKTVIDIQWKAQNGALDPASYSEHYVEH